MKNYGKYCPNPQFERKDYQFLCGEWEFAFGDSDAPPAFDRTIVVPYSYECKASGIGDESVHNRVYYRRKFTVKAHRGKLLLWFEAVDYRAEIYVNGTFAGEHAGGFTQFCIDVTALAHEGENTLAVCVEDSLSKSQLRGKQRAKESSYDCWYVQTTGIWKPVWLEYAGDAYLLGCSFDAKRSGAVRYALNLSEPAQASIEAFDGDRLVAREVCAGARCEGEFFIADPKLWSSDSPNLYRVKITVNGTVPDRVDSYFGIREIELKEDGVYVNGRREFQQMILDQGYWEDTMLTAPDEDALEKDVKLIKRMGFNGVRKHQKVESGVFYYFCDLYGLYVWGEIPSPYAFDERMQEDYLRDGKDIVLQLRNHPSVICWLLFNETWGVSEIKTDVNEQQFVERAYETVRALDSRPIITNDGWHHLNSDILSLHEYEQDPELFTKEYAEKDYVVSRKVINVNTYGNAFAKGYRYGGQPIMISEYGGIAIAGEGWGYGAGAADIEDYETRVRKIVGAIDGIDYLSGCCYTQLTDVQQEVNGLLTADRVPKIPLERVCEIFGARK